MTNELPQHAIIMNDGIALRLHLLRLAAALSMQKDNNTMGLAYAMLDFVTGCREETVVAADNTLTPIIKTRPPQPAESPEPGTPVEETPLTPETEKADLHSKFKVTKGQSEVLEMLQVLQDSDGDCTAQGVSEALKKDRGSVYTMLEALYFKKHVTKVKRDGRCYYAVRKQDVLA